MIEQHITNTCNNNIPNNKLNNNKNNFNQKICYHLSKKYTLPNIINSSKSVKDVFNYKNIPHPNEINTKGNEIKHTNTSKNLIPNRTQTLQSQSNATLHLSSKRSLSPKLKAKQSSKVTNNFEFSSQNCLSHEIDNDTNNMTNMNNIYYSNTRKPQRRQGINIKPLSSLTPKSSDKKFTLIKALTQSLTKDNFSLNTPCSNKCKRIIKDVIESDIEAGVMASFFLIGLFLSDIKTIFLSIKYDVLFDSIYVGLAIILLIEIICSGIVITHYLNSFFFWLDIFSVFSLLTEIENSKKVILYLFLTPEEQNKSTNPQTERIWTVLRLLKIIKMIRIVKVYKAVITFAKNYEIRKKLEEIRNKEIEKIKNKEKKTTAVSIKKKRTTAIPTQINNFVSSIDANNSNMNLNATSNIQDNNKHPHYKSAATLNSVLSINTKQLDNINSSPNNMNMNFNNTTVFPIPTNFAAEAALKKMIANRQKERKKSLQMESKTKITKVLFLSITQKILIIILFLFFIPPLLDEDFYSKDTNSNYRLLSNFFEYYLSPLTNSGFVSLQNNTYIKSHVNYPIIYILYLNNHTLFTNYSLPTNLDDYRFWEYHKAHSFQKKITIIYSSKKVSVINSYNNIVKTILTLVIMFYLSVLINSDLDLFVLKPLEMMLDIVQAVAKDPVNYKSIEEMNKNMLKSAVQSKKGSKQNIDTETLSVDYEIRTLQFAILRISALIAIGFGEAGGEILKENINSEQGLNPMIPGKRIQSVFGFCFIKNFTEINEVLQEKTILFVNTIADIVHSSVDKFQGVCNKNIGDCFLLVWKFKGINNTITNLNNSNSNNNNNSEMPSKIKQSKEDLHSILKETIRQFKLKTENEVNDKCINDPNLQLIADSALVSFLCVIKKIRKSQSILTLNKDPLLQTRFGQNFKIQMGFGLHIGWGIEGAIGSFYKIDCSYLSPNVNTAARLETATNIYGVDILLSGDLYNCFSEYTQKLCRQIDTVALKGCLFPVKLYTVDLNPFMRQGKFKRKILTGKEKRKLINIKRAKLKNLFDRAHVDGKSKSITEIYYKMSKGFRMLLKDVKSEDFKKYFQLGFDEYIRGNWELAYRHLKQANYIEPSDCPTVKLCNFIFANGRKAPLDWKGFRKLDSKF